MGKQSLHVYKPSILGDFTQEMFNKAGELGLDMDGVKKLNIERYINKLQSLQKDGMQLSIMPEQTKEMVLTAIYQNPAAIQYANEQDEKSKAIVISRNSSNICFINDPTDEDIQMVIDLEPRSILHAKKYSREKAMLAIEREPMLIFDINKDYIDEGMMIFLLDLLKDEAKMKLFFYSDMYTHTSAFKSPLTLFNNENVQKYALSISPVFLNFMKPQDLEESVIIGIMEKDVSYLEKMFENKYVFGRNLAFQILKHDFVKKNLRKLVWNLDYDCMNSEFMKYIVEISRDERRVDFFELWNWLQQNPRTHVITTFLHDKVDEIFEKEGAIDLSDAPNGFSHKKVIEMALKKNKKHSKYYLNIWRTKVTKKK